MQIKKPVSDDSVSKDATLLAKLKLAKKEIKKGNYFTQKQIESLYKK